MSNDSAGRDDLRSVVEAHITDLKNTAKRIRRSEYASQFESTAKEFDKAAGELMAALSRQAAQGGEAAVEVTDGRPFGFKFHATLKPGDKLYLAPPDTVPRAELERLEEAQRWRPVSEKPTEPGSYLVMLADDNFLGLTTEHAVQAEWDFWSDMPGLWTMYDSEQLNANTDMTADILCWQPLPPPPEREADTITPAIEFLMGMAAPSGGEDGK